MIGRELNSVRRNWALGAPQTEQERPGDRWKLWESSETALRGPCSVTLAPRAGATLRRSLVARLPSSVEPPAALCRLVSTVGSLLVRVPCCPRAGSPAVSLDRAAPGRTEYRSRRAPGRGRRETAAGSQRAAQIV